MGRRSRIDKSRKSGLAIATSSAVVAAGGFTAVRSAGVSFATLTRSGSAATSGPIQRKLLRGSQSEEQRLDNWNVASTFCGSLALGATVALSATRPRSSAGSKTKVTCKAMFERFTANSMKAIMMAQAESRSLGHDYVGTEMLIIGILSEGNDQGWKVLSDVGLKLEEARAKLKDMLGTGSGVKGYDIPFTRGAKEALEKAVAIAQGENSASVSSGHLLHALLLQDESVGMKLLGQLLRTASPTETREQVLNMLLENSKVSAGQPAQQAEANAAAKPAGKDDGLNLKETMKFAEDLTAKAEQGLLDPLVGRDAQIERTIRILGRRSKNNPILVGEAGVGKTSIASGLAQRIVQGKVPPTLRGKRILSLDLALLLSGTRYRGDFEERLRAVVQEVTDSKRKVILVIDEVHTLVGAGSGGGDGGGMDAANMLKPALARGDLQCIGATTLDEYRQYIEKDPALERRFQPVLVPEPTEEEAETILAGLAPRYEQHHELKYTPAAIKAAVKLSSQYISDRFLPDKAIDVMDEAGAKVRQQIFQAEGYGNDVNPVVTLEEELQEIRKSKAEAVQIEDYEGAKQLKARETEVEAQLSELRSNGKLDKKNAELDEELKAIQAAIREAVDTEQYDKASALKKRQLEVLGTSQPGQTEAQKEVWVTEEDVAQVVSGWTGVAVEKVTASESSRLMHLEDILSECVVGQEEAVKSVSRSLRRARAGLRSPTRPIAAFMFSGPTGVGKTELCKTLASCFFGSEDSMIRLDMSEFMEKHTVSKLIGSPPGYVGYGDGGGLTEAIRRRPYSLVLFDEVEKAHPDVFNLLLQLLDDGRLTDSKGRVVSFANAMIIMTTNLGSRSVQKGAGGGASLGFASQEDDQEEANYSKIRELVHEEMKSFFRPEFLNRLDEICVFRPLTKNDVRRIAEVEFRKVMARMSVNGMRIALTGRFKEHVVEAGFDPTYGARPLRRAITRLLEDTLAEHLLGCSAEELEERDETSAEDPKARNTRALVDILEDGRIEVIPLGTQRQSKDQLADA
eukprot:TRINITY_DN37508_c0_g1_i2.p1 TRINITY_DN37508_c0_g1~~TRINITY_DN37508_c0_g1_i2.p1  ORF type:complete len:1026 (-),score=279.89 TRINITY_DN37508_c0_g1_i2:176-3253(-)